ncbi:MAG: type II toxin-antitoxin system VapC family toxin, partial [Solirubrobacteraceae bacterium]
CVSPRQFEQILDTGPLVALIDRSDPDHERCAQLLATTSERRVVPLCVLVEVEYLLRPWPGGFAALMTDVNAGRLETHLPDDHELARAAALVDTYADLPLGFVDASVLAAVEHLSETKVATLDRRHFNIARPSHVDHLTLLPD